MPTQSEQRGQATAQSQESKPESVITETICFITYTMESKLCERLQRVDNLFAELHCQPRVRFVERPGDTIERELGRSDPWAGDFFCPRTECLPCNTRRELIEEKRQKRQTGSTQNVQERRDKSRMESFLPGCTVESVGNVLECGMCRDKGVKRWYCGESSRSASQRGSEHWQDIEDGELSHPIVRHAWEEHRG